jgi:hypothetical protein
MSCIVATRHRTVLCTRNLKAVVDWFGCSVRGTAWRSRWFVISRCGKVHYYAQQADEQAHGIAKDNGEPSGERLKGEFSLRDCIRFSTPKRELSILVCNHQPMFDPAVATFSPISTVYLDPRMSLSWLVVCGWS